MARYLIDANLPRRFSLWSGPDYDFVHDIGDGLKDSDVWRIAAERSLVIVDDGHLVRRLRRERYKSSGTGLHR